MTPKTQDKKRKKAINFERAMRFLKKKQKVLNGFESKIFPIGQQIQRRSLKTLTLK